VERKTSVLVFDEAAGSLY